MSTAFARSPDHIRIAYDIQGTIDGVDHAGELKEIDKVLPVMTAFTVA